MSSFTIASKSIPSAQRDYRLIHDVYIVLDAIDRCVLSPYGLTNAQYRLMSLLDVDNGRRLTDLSDQMICNRSTITRLIDKLEAKGLVRRVVHADDRRAQQVVLTPSGQVLREQATEAHDRSLIERIAHLSPDEQSQLNILLEKMRVSLRSDLEIREKNGERSVKSLDVDE